MEVFFNIIYTNIIIYSFIEIKKKKKKHQEFESTKDL